MGDELIKIIKKEKINSKYVFQDKNVKTGIALANIDAKGDSSYIFYKPSGTETAFKKTDIPSSLLKKAKVFHTGSAYTYSDHTFEATLSLLQRAKKENLFITYDPNWREGRIKDKTKTRMRIKKLTSYASLLKLSESDALGITGCKTLLSALNKLGGNLVVTLGEKGAFFWDGKEKFHTPSFKVNTKDTIGAGDGFTAGLIYQYYKKGAVSFWKEISKRNNTILSFAAAVSAIICQGPGAQGKLKNIKQVKTFIRQRT